MKDNLQSSILVAIDMGAHNFKAMAAQFTDNGLLRVLGVEESSQKNCVDHRKNKRSVSQYFRADTAVEQISNHARCP